MTITFPLVQIKIFLSITSKATAKKKLSRISLRRRYYQKTCTYTHLHNQTRSTSRLPSSVRQLKQTVPSGEECRARTSVTALVNKHRFRQRSGDSRCRLRLMEESAGPIRPACSVLNCLLFHKTLELEHIDGCRVEKRRG